MTEPEAAVNRVFAKYGLMPEPKPQLDDLQLLLAIAYELSRYECSAKTRS